MQHVVAIAPYLSSSPQGACLADIDQNGVSKRGLLAQCLQAHKHVARLATCSNWQATAPSVL